MRSKTARYALVATLLVLTLVATLPASAGSSRNFRAHLAGRNEVPPVSTLGQGQAIVQISKDESSINFKLIAANIEDVTQAHIHCGPADDNGPVVAFLYGFGPTVSPDGVLSQGTLTASDVIPRPDSAGCPGGVADLGSLIAQIRAGNTYVNVHTLANPGGEIRGQLR